MFKQNFLFFKIEIEKKNIASNPRPNIQGYHYVLVRNFETLWGPWCVDFINFFNEQ